MTKGSKNKVKTVNSGSKERNMQASGTVNVSPPTSVHQVQMAAPMNRPADTILSQARDVLYGDQSQQQFYPQMVSPKICSQTYLPQELSQNQRKEQTQNVQNGQITVHQGPQQDGQFKQLLNTADIYYQHGQFASENSQNVQNLTLTSGTALPREEVCKQTMYTGMNLGVQNQSEAPSWVNTILKNLDSRLQNIEAQLSQQNSRWQFIESQLQSQNSQLQNQNIRMTNIEQKFAQVTDIQHNISSVELKVSNIDAEVKSVQSQMATYNESIGYFNDMYDDIVSDDSARKSTVDNLIKRVENIETEQQSIKSKQSSVEEKVLDLQCRSMRENLLFTGIPESESIDAGDREDSESVLRDFLCNKMNITDDIKFDRVHRLGRQNYQQNYPRPLIAKFHQYKDRERIRLTAPKVLRGTPYGVREQFPAEIEAVRRTLYPAAKRAREKEQKVRLVRDRLFINDVQYIPRNTSTEAGPFQQQSNEAYRPRSKTVADQNSETAVPIAQRTRVFRSRNTFTAVSASEFTTPNRYTLLNTAEEYDESSTSKVESRKQKATSPLENELAYVKKVRENSNSEKLKTCSQESPQEPMETQTIIIESPALQSLQQIDSQEHNSQNESRDSSPARNVDSNASH